MTFFRILKIIKRLQAETAAGLDALFITDFEQKVTKGTKKQKSSDLG